MNKIDHLTRDEISSRPLLAKKINHMIDRINFLLGAMSILGIETLDSLEEQRREKTGGGKKKNENKRHTGKDG